VISFGYLLSIEFAGSYVSAVFNFLRNCLIVFHNDYTNLYFYQQYVRIPFSPHAFGQYLLLFILVTILSQVW
jgi:hypothetical protein